MRMVCLSNLLDDAKKYKVILLLTVLVCAAAGGLYGYKAAGAAGRITAAEQEQIDLYQLKVAEYDGILSDLDKAVLEQEKTVESLQDYVDHSIYMKMDPESVKYTTVQYAITYGEGVNSGNVNNALVTYIKDGGLKESVENPEELEIKYWNEVLTQGVSGNTLSIAMMHYDAEKAKTCISAVMKQLEKQLPKLKAVYGNFSLSEGVISSFERSEAAIINTQNGNYNNLRSYNNTLADLKNRYSTNRTAKEKYIRENEPEALKRQPVSAKKNAVKFLILGVFGAVLILLAVELFIYLFGETIKNRSYIEAMDIPVLSVKNGSKYHPELERMLMDLSLLKDAKDIKGVHFQAISKEMLTDSEQDLVKEMLEKYGLAVTFGSGIFETASDVRSALQAGCCVLIIKQGRTQVRELKEAVNVCRKYGMEMPGCVLF